jgi:hypothetical protein
VAQSGSAFGWAERSRVRVSPPRLGDFHVQFQELFVARTKIRSPDSLPRMWTAIAAAAVGGFIVLTVPRLLGAIRTA